MSRKKDAMETINLRILQVRKFFKLTQEVFSKKIGISRSYLANIEGGAKKPSIEGLVGIVSNFKINPLWLMVGMGKMLNEISQAGKIPFLPIWIRLKEALNITKDEDLAENLRIKPEKMALFLVYNEIPLALLLELCEINSLDLNWVFWGKGRPKYYPPQIQPVEMPLRIGDKWSKRIYELGGGQKLENYIPIPFLADQFATRSPMEIKGEEIIGFVVIAKEWCRNAENCVCARVVDDSMNPILRGGSIVVVDHSQKDPGDLDGKMVAFRRGSGLTVKWLRLISKDVVVAYPENRRSKDILFLAGEEICRAIVGRIQCWWGRQP
jgi:transcriptional regulator with XRE-family HTH domain